MRLKGKAAIVTGGGGGIGAAVAMLFCAEGAKVLIVDRAADGLSSMLAAIREKHASAEVQVLQADVTNPLDARRAVDAAVGTFGGLDVLVNNAAFRNVDTLADADIGQWRKVLETNVIGAVSFCKASLPALRKSGSASVVNVSSCYAVRGRKGFAAYDASKAALLAMTRTLAVEEAEHGIRVNAVCPGGTLTPFTIARGRAKGRTEAGMRAGLKSDSLLRRWAEPLEVAYPILWLASDEASFITGAALMVDGGLSAL